MARQEHEREDLLAEATALVERVEIELTPRSASVGSAKTEETPGPRIVLGFRRDGAASLYWNEDPAWHFNTSGELRRAYHGGRLYKAERGSLVALDRRRMEHEVRLIRHELNATETAAILDELRQSATSLATAIAAGQYRLVGQVPPQADVLGRAAPLLAALSAKVEIAASPRVQ